MPLGLIGVLLFLLYPCLYVILMVVFLKGFHETLDGGGKVYLILFAYLLPNFHIKINKIIAGLLF